VLKLEAGFDLLFTDVVMPGGLNGRQLAEEARKLNPGLRVIFSSGYADSAVAHHGGLDQGVHLLNKPYRRSDLAKKVREALA
jgi:DNA-binding LytR/AlgR family response regulator